MTAHARIKCTIWRDEEFRDLSVDAQWTYQRLLSDSSRNQAGVLALTRRRWAGSAAGMTRERLDAALDELVAGTFVVLDEDTEEVLIRTYIRHNDIALQPNILKAALKQAARVESPLLRSALAHELRLLPEKPADTARMVYPDPHAVAEEIDPGDLAPRLSVVREAPALSDVSADQAHPRKGSANPSDNPSSKTGEQEREQVTGVGGGVGGEPALFHTAEQLAVPEPPAKASPRGARLDEHWMPSDDTRAWSFQLAGELDITNEWAKFQDYWMSKAGAGARKLDWDRTWKNWLRTAAERSRGRRGAAPNGMTPKDAKVANIVAMGQRMQADQVQAEFALAIENTRRLAEW